ncbi:MAG: hypothetical protein P4L81_02635 [Candidatus Pacebacteria bacterium]|nr:hypothetical protein [Candidatus Paceibacterota bacterium]
MAMTPPIPTTTTSCRIHVPDESCQIEAEAGPSTAAPTMLVRHRVDITVLFATIRYKPLLGKVAASSRKNRLLAAKK